MKSKGFFSTLAKVLLAASLLVANISLVQANEGGSDDDGVAKSNECEPALSSESKSKTTAKKPQRKMSPLCRSSFSSCAKTFSSNSFFSF